MPMALISVVLGLINKYIPDPAQKAAAQQQVMSAFYQYQSDFISKTSDALNRVLRVLIVGAFVGGLFYHPLAQQAIQSIQAIAAAGPAGLVYLSVILWEFYGASALQILPWFKGSAGSAITAVTANDPVLPPVPTSPLAPTLPPVTTPRGGDAPSQPTPPRVLSPEDAADTLRKERPELYGRER